MTVHTPVEEAHLQPSTSAPERSVCRCLGHIVIAIAVLVMAGQVPNIVVKGALGAFRVGGP